jgi:hypothetical protein
MGQNAPRDQQRAPQPDIYWRRRVIALALGISIVGLLAWAVNGVVSGGNATSQAADVGHAKRAVVPPPVSAFTTPPIATASASAQPSASGTQSPGPGRSPAATLTPTPTPTHKPVTTAHQGDGCAPGDVVINLTANSSSYSLGAQPQFGVSVVSTSAHTCAFDMGAKGVRLVIKSGSARVWASSDCASGGGSRAAKLARGVPVALHFSWARKTSTPDCGPVVTVARPGTYTATIYSGLITSNTVVFVLRGPVGAAQP